MTSDPSPTTAARARSCPTWARATARAAAASALVGLAVGCSPADTDADQLVVYAAASLAVPFAQIEADFEATHPGVDVVMVHGGSAGLAAQILEGAPADVFAAANQVQMANVADETAVAPQVFATNTLTIAVADGNPAGVAGLADLADPGLVTVVCAPQVPCGASTARLAEARGVTLAPASQEGSVTDVLGKVDSGQADAGVVYVTDIARADGVDGVPIPGAEEFANQYPIAPLARASDPALAASFVGHVLGEGQEALREAGFGAP